MTAVLNQSSEKLEEKESRIVDLERELEKTRQSNFELVNAEERMTAGLMQKSKEQESRIADLERELAKSHGRVSELESQANSLRDVAQDQSKKIASSAKQASENEIAYGATIKEQQEHIADLEGELEKSRQEQQGRQDGRGRLGALAEPKLARV